MTPILLVSTLFLVVSLTGTFNYGFGGGGNGHFVDAKEVGDSEAKRDTHGLPGGYRERRAGSHPDAYRQWRLDKGNRDGRDVEQQFSDGFPGDHRDKRGTRTKGVPETYYREKRAGSHPDAYRQWRLDKGNRDGRDVLQMPADPFRGKRGFDPGTDRLDHRHMVRDVEKQFSGRFLPGDPRPAARIQGKRDIHGIPGAYREERGRLWNELRGKRDSNPNSGANLLPGWNGGR